MIEFLTNIKKASDLIGSKAFTTDTYRFASAPLEYVVLPDVPQHQEISTALYKAMTGIKIVPGMKRAFFLDCTRILKPSYICMSMEDLDGILITPPAGTVVNIDRKPLKRAAIGWIFAGPFGAVLGAQTGTQTTKYIPGQATIELFAQGIRIVWRVSEKDYPKATKFFGHFFGEKVSYLQEGE